MPKGIMKSTFYRGMIYTDLYKYVKEDYIPSDDLWFITITLCPKTFKYSAVTQYEMTVNEVRTIMEAWCSQYTLTVELTDAGNVHYHAIAKILTKTQRIRIIESCKKKRVLGFIKINTLPINMDEMLHKSCNYIIKELDKTTEIIKRGCYKPELLFIKNMR